ncbi:MAG: hypothetical protein GTN69_02455 [Armatimonadetes bacterium]|nr:hypothetical protein [Armatimonadota bacterium]
MLLVDRASFIAWIQGTLLDRREDGSMVVGDDVAHERAEAALEDGETIGLTVGGRLVTTMAYDADADGYVETEVEE